MIGPELDGPHRRTLTPNERADRLAARLILIAVAFALAFLIAILKDS